MAPEDSLEQKKQTLLLLGERAAQEGMLFHERMATKVGLNPTDMRAISLLRDSEPLTPGEIAAGMRVSASAATTIIDRLERAGFVRREAHPADRRKLTVILDIKRLEEVNRLYQPLFTEMDKLFSTYKGAEFDLLIDFHSACIDVFKKARPK